MLTITRERAKSCPHVDKERLCPIRGAHDRLLKGWVLCSPTGAVTEMCIPELFTYLSTFQIVVLFFSVLTGRKSL